MGLDFGEQHDLAIPSKQAEGFIPVPADSQLPPAEAPKICVACGDEFPARQRSRAYGEHCCRCAVIYRRARGDMGQRARNWKRAARKAQREAKEMRAVIRARILLDRLEGPLPEDRGEDE